MNGSSENIILAQNSTATAIPETSSARDPIKDIVPLEIQKAIKTHAAERIPEGFFWTVHYSASFFIILALVLIAIGRPTRSQNML